MSLKLKGRGVYKKEVDSNGCKWTVYGIITDDPIYIKVRIKSGGVITVREKDLHFGVEKKGKGK